MFSHFRARTLFPNRRLDADIIIILTIHLWPYRNRSSQFWQFQQIMQDLSNYWKICRMQAMNLHFLQILSCGLTCYVLGMLCNKLPARLDTAQTACSRRWWRERAIPRPVHAMVQYDRLRMSLDWDNLETPVQAFARKMPPKGETWWRGDGGGTPCRIGSELLFAQ